MILMSYKNYSKNSLRIYTLLNYIKGGFYDEGNLVNLKNEIESLKNINGKAKYWKYYEKYIKMNKNLMCSF